ncbi:Protein hunchback, partial [Acromyrmex echinatior]
VQYSQVQFIYKNINLFKEFIRYPNIMNEYRTDRSLSIMSNIIPLLSESINPIQNILQCSLCVFATSNRSEFSEHLTSHYTSKRNNSSLKAVLTHLPILKSPLNQNDNSSSPFILAEYKHKKREETDESSLHVSRVNLQSNISKQDKSFREAKNCKQCNFIASTKMEYWEHMRCHIKGFTCSECSFVTKYKHHMNHHWLSVHDGSKPFKCKKCLYTCVSKSMLTSHLKKHSNIYPYRCADCTYKTKFCNALKKHLRKKEHQPAVVLNADGSPNPLSIIDVYGTKRGPKQKSSAKNQETSKNIVAASNTNNQLDSTVTSSPLSLYSSIARYLTLTAINGISNGHWINHDMNKNQSVTMFPYSDLIAAFNLSNHILLCENATLADENLQKTDNAQSDILTEYAKMFTILSANKMPEMFAQSLSDFDTTNNIGEPDFSDNMKTISESSTFLAIKTQLECHRTESIDIPLDLRMIDVIKNNHLQFQALTDTTSSKVSGTSKRKGKAIKLEHRLIKNNTDKKSEQNEDESFINKSPSNDFYKISQKIKNTKDKVDLFDAKLTCYYCEIVFGNVIMYAVHMGCHNFDDPYTCNICGHQCIDKLSFFLHIAQSEH